MQAFGGVMEKQIFNDTDFYMLVYRYVEKYLKLKKSYEIAKRILSENCHDFFITMNFDCERSNYNNMLELAKKRNLNVDVSLLSVDCSVFDVCSILKTMCVLELIWLDEHRAIFQSDSDINSNYFVEEENTLKFYSGLISGLSADEVDMISKSLDDDYFLTLH